MVGKKTATTKTKTTKAKTTKAKTTKAKTTKANTHINMSTVNTVNTVNTTDVVNTATTTDAVNGTHVATAALDTSDTLTAVSTTQPIEDLVNALLKEHKDITELHKKHTRNIKECLKLYKREHKRYLKLLPKKKDPNRPKKNNAFTTPTSISDNLCTFLKKPKGTLVARSNVTKAISKYIKSNNLFVPENKKQFIPDNNLSSILSPLKEKDLETGYTYFNLQHYIATEFTKKTTDVVQTSTESVSTL